MYSCFALLIQARGVLWHDANTYPLTTFFFALTNTLLVQFSLWSFGLYSREVVYSGQKLSSNLIGAFLFSAGLLFPACFIFSLTKIAIIDFTLKFYLIALVAFISMIALERFFVLKVFYESPSFGNVLVLGTGPATELLIKEARASHGKTFHLSGILSENAEDIGKEILGCKIMGTLEDLGPISLSHKFGTILISTPIYSRNLPMNDLLRAKVAGTKVFDAADFYEQVERKILLEKIEPIQLLLSENLLMTRFRWFLKDTLEKLVAIALLIAASPIMLLSALLIKLTSPGPLFYLQKREGKDGHLFYLVKFRTMVQDAEKESGPVWAKASDDRATWIGRILRQTRIDELPQIFNVLKGDMAFVGPRPERPEFVELLRSQIPYYDQRHLVKPGITGWAQVCYPYGASVEAAREKLRFDLYYIKNMSIFFDLMIVLATVRTVLFKAYAR
ncbi:MAG: TIGR03013 family PEP-CTERM/XrtA system glycosyltransferase [Planctomycetes bacterium]|nr:TIGR03013 family PEP-CTERM/XrtA system glycosyltransferase [Planctomycetota bacterium]